MKQTEAGARLLRAIAEFEADSPSAKSYNLYVFKKLADIKAILRAPTNRLP